MKGKIVRGLAILAAFGMLVGLTAPALAAGPEEAPPRPAVERKVLELHWGWVDGVNPPGTAAAVEVQGTVRLSDGDPETREGVAPLGAILWEEEDRLDVRRSVWPVARRSETDLGWASQVSGDWDGIALLLTWEEGTDPILTLDLGGWRWEGPVSQVEEAFGRHILEGEVEVELGEPYGLTYRVYRLEVGWGKGRAPSEGDEASPDALAGSLSLSDGVFVVHDTPALEEGDELTGGDYTPTLAWDASLANDEGRRKIDGFRAWIVVPSEEAVTLTAEVGEESKEVTLPETPRTVVRVLRVDGFRMGIRLAPGLQGARKGRPGWGKGVRSAPFGPDRGRGFGRRGPFGPDRGFGRGAPFPGGF